ncbi:DUF1015 domain-containing protein [Nocardioides sp. cx-169]|uniref:DUF1015 family protein n=1 Tax=Nocardioides sp. cx-169 TaxID=2899080 RepID=UPI001E3493A9|nr:DUF1015 family protein [Nocardioides sp. cx-169]MCD4536488.1 DUF1015 domain-containing protein [Nocardioides sp. cx-169]
MESSAVVTPPYVGGPLRLVPFRALMLAPSRIGDPSSARAFARPYRDVAARLERWRAQGQMTRDEEPALYLHEYTAAGITIRGLVGLLDVSRRAARAEDRAILPHEGVYPAQADDLADRMSQMQLNPAPILLVHRGPAPLRALLARVQRRVPEHDFTDRNGQQHRVWPIRDPDELAAIADLLARETALIADGHHRYAAYLRLHTRDPGSASDYGLAMLVDQEDTPLFLGAIHRVLTGTSVDDVLAAAAAVGMGVEETTAEAAVAALDPDHVVITDSDRWAVLKVTVPPDRTAVQLLHDQLIPALPYGPRDIRYHHTVDDALAQVGPDVGVAVLMPAPLVDRILRIVRNDGLLPEKATSFQPKPSLGVLIRSLHDG